MFHLETCVTQFFSIPEDPVLVKTKTSFVSPVYAAPTCQYVLLKVLKDVEIVVVEVTERGSFSHRVKLMIGDECTLVYLLSSPHTLRVSH